MGCSIQPTAFFNSLKQNQMKATKKEIEQARRFASFLINTSADQKEKQFEDKLLKESFLINKKSDNK